MLKILQNYFNFKILIGTLFAIITVCHVVNLTTVPNGLYLDEVSIGLNAATISQTGADEYGTAWPLYFKSFGEYKNPVYIYAAAALFKVFGVSDLVLRLTSSLFFLIALVGAFLLSRRLTPSKTAQVFTLLSLGFLPQYFTLSRISFEAISELAVTTWLLYYTHLVFEKNDGISPRFAKLSPLVLPVVTGLLAALTIYTYSIARLWTFLFLALLILIYHQQQYRRRLTLILLSAGGGLLPWIWYYFSHPGALTGRFSEISYLSNPATAWWEKIGTFGQQYLIYWQLDFLVIHGDYNPRHAISYGGIIFISSLLLALVGLVVIAKTPALRQQPFVRLLMGCLLISPLPAALTTEGSPHLIRSLLFGWCLTAVGIFGWEYLLQIDRQAILRPILFGLLSLEIVSYLGFYFVAYPIPSAAAFGSSGFENALQTAVRSKPNTIKVSPNAGQAYVFPAYYQYVIDNPEGISIQLAPPVPEPSACLVYWSWEEAVLNQSSLEFTQINGQNDIARGRCY